MNRILFSGIVAVVLMIQTSASAIPPVVDFQNKTQLSTTPSAKLLNIEAPFRCSVKMWGDQEISTTIALKDNDFKMTFFDAMDSLPRYEVNGFSFDKKPVDEALQDLVEEADITVYTEDGVYPDLNADGVYGELSDVVAELSRAGGVFYRYDADRKELYLSRKGRFELHLPDNRMVMLAVLDALRGAGIDNVTPDWKNNTLMMTITQDEKETIQSLIDYIIQDTYLLLADTQVFHLIPKTTDFNWQKTVESFGKGKVYTATSGLMGKILTMGHQQKSETFLSELNKDFKISPISQGVAIVPNGWKMRFDVGQCASLHNISSLSVLLSTRIKSPDQVETNVTLDTKTGEISTFETVSAIDNELVILGIPTLNQSDAPNNELLVTLKLRLIRLLKEK